MRGLASRLTGYKIDIKSETQARESGLLDDLELGYEQGFEGYAEEPFDSFSEEAGADENHAEEDGTATFGMWILQAMRQRKASGRKTTRSSKDLTGVIKEKEDWEVRNVEYKKIPQRQCIGCGEMKNKKEMLRVLKTTDDQIIIDATGRKNGPRRLYLSI